MICFVTATLSVAAPQLSATWPRLPLAVSVPGAVDGWCELHARFGRLPLRDLLQPSIAYAREGFPVTEVIGALRACQERLRVMINRGDHRALDAVSEQRAAALLIGAASARR